MLFLGGQSRRKYSGSEKINKDASSEMGTDYSTEELTVNLTVQIWARSAGAVSRYKMIKKNLSA
jgi:hypothetical protein